MPIFAVTGWTDVLMPPVETLQMYRRLKQLDADYPIWILFNDTGHGISSDETPQRHLKLTNDRRAAFFDRHLRSADIDVGPEVDSLPTSCGDADDKTRVTAPNWDGIQGEAITLSVTGDSQTTTHDGRSAELDGVGGDIGATCATGSERTPGAARWTWAAPLSGATLLGLPTVSVDYVLNGVDATLVAKLWDVPAGENPERTLITRGVYRLTGPAAASSGSATFQLFGNHWNVEPGHRIQLELLQSDAPVFQADKLPSSLTLSSPTVRFPTARPG